MKIGILGGGGCFGLNAARHFHSLGVDCFGIGRSKRKAEPFNLEPKGYRYYDLHIVDELDRVACVLETERPETIVNFCAQGEGAASFGNNCDDFYRTNTWGLARLVNYLRGRDWLSRFIHIGTSELYGSVDLPAKETNPIRATSPYAVSKAAFDAHLEIMHRVHGFPMNIIRPSNCYTPGQQLYRVIPRAIVCALSGRKLPLHGGGRAQKSYLHADDLSDAIMMVIRCGHVGKIYNCGTRVPISIRDLVFAVAHACDVTFDDLVEEVPDRVGQDGRYWLDSSALAKDTGWTQTIGIERGLQTMVEWVRKFPELLTMSQAYVHRV